MPYGCKHESKYSEWYDGVLGGKDAWVSNGTKSVAGQITLKGVQQAYEQCQHKFWNNIMSIVYTSPGATEVRFPVMTQPAGGFAASGGLEALGGVPIVTDVRVPVGDIYYSYAQYQTESIQWQMNYQYQMNEWVGTATSGSIYQYAVNGFAETAEERRARKVREADRMQKLKDAEKRAEDLLIMMLSDEQIAQYQKHGYFETDVNGKVYRITKGRSGNVQLIENDKPKFKYCAHPSDMTPDQDVMLSQLLMLQTDEAKFLKTANRTVLHN